MSDVRNGTLSASEPCQAAPPRVVFIDVARAFATLMMLQGHTIDALLAGEYRTGGGYYAWTFVRGLTPCLFLFLSGFAFTVVARKPDGPGKLGPTLHRFRRVGFLLVLGYALHFPVGSLSGLHTVPAEGWRGFLAVDVLQCIAIMLGVLQVLALWARTPNRRLTAAAATCITVVALTPVMWRAAASTTLPIAMASYLSPATGSLFPLFPWTAYGFFGAVIGEIYLRPGIAHPRMFARTVLAPTGVGLLAMAFATANLSLQPLGPTHFWTTSPSQFLLRAGLVCLVVGGIAHASWRVQRRLPFVEALARESLVVYFVHVCLVYGSAWNRGLRQIYGATLPPMAAVSWVFVLWTSMGLLAWIWRAWKDRTPRTTVWLRAAATGVLLVLLV